MDNAQDDSGTNSLDKELALEAQMRAIAAELEQLRSVNREAALSDVREKIKRYKLTRTELASSFPVLRQPSIKSAQPTLNADGTERKKRGRKPKSQTVAEVE